MRVEGGKRLGMKERLREILANAANRRLAANGPPPDGCNITDVL
jgi:hypothetical protein